MRTYHLKRRYGLTADGVQELIDEQRGMCFTCNAGLGNFGEDRERMRAAIIYLEVFEAAATALKRRTA